MEIKTKLNVDDSAWMIKDNRVIETIITVVYVIVKRDNLGIMRTEIKYSVKDSSTNVYEYQLFPTKQDLLNSL